MQNPMRLQVVFSAYSACEVSIEKKPLLCYNYTVIVSQFACFLCLQHPQTAYRKDAASTGIAIGSCNQAFLHSNADFNDITINFSRRTRK